MDIIGGQHLRQMWDDLADVYGHKTALICESSGGVVNRYSYLELNQEINRTANLFYTLGIRKGDKVALHLDNCPEFIFCWFGLAKIGAIMVPINARLLREESTWILQNSQACLLVTSAQFYPMYQQIQQEDASQLRHICLTDVPQLSGIFLLNLLIHRHHLPTERGGDNSLQPALRWILLRLAVCTA